MVGPTMKKEYLLIAAPQGARWPSTVPVCSGGLRFVIDYFKEFTSAETNPYTLYWLARINKDFDLESIMHDPRALFKNVVHEEDIGSYNVEPFRSFVDLNAPVRNRGILKECVDGKV